VAAPDRGRLSSGGLRTVRRLSPPVERLILALRSDYGCLVIVLAFVVIMISTIVFADIITPAPGGPFV